MRILGIETSCDDTGVAVYDEEQGLLAHRLYSQTALHADYGGVVPELASRDHIRKLLPLLHATLKEGNIKPSTLNAVAYTAGPGLAGALLVGTAVGRALAYGWGISAVPVHHMEGHLLSPMLEERAPPYPFLALLVSGGHTMLVYVEQIGRYTHLGESLDDAAGECFDKTAKLLGLGYPGGPAVARAAMNGRPERFRLPRPMAGKANLNFSFSGLKTAVLETVKNIELTPQNIADVASAAQEAIIDTLLGKCQRALQQTKARHIVIAGGVSANERLRARANALAKQLNISVYYPRPSFCTDNAAMIAYAGACRLRAGQHEDALNFSVRARWPLPSNL